MTNNKDKRYQYIIYKLCSDYCDQFYVGSTRNMAQRKKGHKSASNNSNDKAYNSKIYKSIREHGGWENFRIVPLELMENTTKFEAECREEFHRLELKAMLNSCKATRGNMTQLEYHQQYRIDNREAVLERNKQYYQNNKEKIIAERCQKHNCNCGGKYTINHKARHMKSKKHQKYISTLNNL